MGLPVPPLACDRGGYFVYVGCHIQDGVKAEDCTRDEEKTTHLCLPISMGCLGYRVLFGTRRGRDKPSNEGIYRIRAFNLDG